ncbi:MAG: MATE family efflux transporter [Firmicutes bacterium]|nr:MATE family efflux transporter [Bacillota bacterium]
MNSEMFIALPAKKLFVQCVVPAVITAVFGALYSVIDGIFVGRFLGENALAAVNLIMPVIMIVEAISNMIATGASVNISLLLGRQEREAASRVFSFSVKFILVFSCVVSVLGFFFAEPFIRLIAPGANGEAIRLSAEYLKVFAMFGPLVPVYFAMDNFLRVCGKPRLSMIINISTQVINVGLNFVLIVLLHQGVRAAAAASCISIVLGSVVTLLLFTGKRMDVFYVRGGVPWPQFFRIIANGSSEFFTSIATSVMSVIMNLFLLHYGGTTAVAAFSIVMYVDSVIGMITFEISDSLQPAISYCYGAKATERLKELFRIILTVTAVLSAGVFLLMFLAGPHLAALFVKPGDTALLEMSVTAVKIFAFSYLVGWIDMCVSSLFTALDRPGRSLLAAVFGTLVFPVAFLFILTALWGLNGVWLMAAVSGAASAALTLILARPLRKDLNI